MKSYDVRRLAAKLGVEVCRIKEVDKFRWYVKSDHNSKYVLLGNDSEEACVVLEEIRIMRGYA